MRVSTAFELSIQPPSQPPPKVHQGLDQASTTQGPSSLRSRSCNLGSFFLCRVGDVRSMMIVDIPSVPRWAESANARRRDGALRLSVRRDRSSRIAGRCACGCTPRRGVARPVFSPLSCSPLVLLLSSVKSRHALQLLPPSATACPYRSSFVLAPLTRLVPPRLVHRSNHVDAHPAGRGEASRGGSAVSRPLVEWTDARPRRPWRMVALIRSRRGYR